MPEHRSFSRVNVAAGTLKDAAWPWRMGAAALGSGMSTSFVVGGGEDR